MAAPHALKVPMDATLSVIVPTLNDDAALARLLPQLQALEPAPAEIIVVDGAGAGALAGTGTGTGMGTDTGAGSAGSATRELVAAAGARYLASDPGRGTQLDLGARAATGSLLWFVHADAAVPPGSARALHDACARGAQGGYFRFRFDGAPRWHKRLLEACIAWRCRVGTVYGDQALFVKRDAYLAAGGFAHEPLFEEVPLVRALKAGGRFVALPQAVIVSARRWERDGYLRRTLLNRLLALGHAAGIAPRRLASAYRRR
jgi:hypothetical protein